MSTKKKNLDLYLAEVYKQFIAIEDNDYKKSQEVFKSVFDQVKQKMGEKCNYFNKYGTQYMYAGSVYDGIKVSKLDEFDIDIVIRLPVDYNNGIIIENAQPGFLKLKIESAFDNLDKQPDWEKCHKVTRDWRDGEKYLLQNKFRQWMHSVVQKALNDMNHKVVVNGVTYLLTYKEAGPAYTLNIRNDVDSEEFKLDVDLVPVIRFQFPRWPEGYRTVEEGVAKDWLVVPKTNKALEGDLQRRCWRLSFQEFERNMMKGCQQLKNTIRLVKKLRDALGLDEIASYYIKTLFLWKIDEKNDRKYWENKLSFTFRVMVEELYKGVKDNNIPYFWNKENNLIAGMRPTIRKLYSEKLKEVLDSIDSNYVDKVVESLLTVDEVQAFKKSEFYEKQIVLFANASSSSLVSQVSRQDSTSSSASCVVDSPRPACKLPQIQQCDTPDLVNSINDKIEAICNPIMELLNKLNNKVDGLTKKVDRQSEKLAKLEKGVYDKIEALTDKVQEQGDRLMLFEKMNIRVNGTETAGVLEIDHNQIRLNKEEKILQGPQKAKVLPLFHAFTGCDTVSSFNNKGKKSAFEVWNAFPTATEGFLAAYEGRILDAMTIIEKFVVILYDSRQIQLIDICE